jgi:hypothetical protein
MPSGSKSIWPAHVEAQGDPELREARRGLIDQRCDRLRRPLGQSIWMRTDRPSRSGYCRTRPRSPLCPERAPLPQITGGPGARRYAEICGDAQERAGPRRRSRRHHHLDTDTDHRQRSFGCRVVSGLSVVGCRDARQCGAHTDCRGARLRVLAPSRADGRADGKESAHGLFVARSSEHDRRAAGHHSGRSRPRDGTRRGAGCCTATSPGTSAEAGADDLAATVAVGIRHRLARLRDRRRRLYGARSRGRALDHGQRPADNLLRRLSGRDAEVQSECDHDDVDEDDAYDDGHHDLLDSNEQHNDDPSAHEHVHFVDRRCNHADHRRPSSWSQRDPDGDDAVAMMHACNQRVRPSERPTPASRSTRG